MEYLFAYLILVVTGGLALFVSMGLFVFALKLLGRKDQLRRFWSEF